MCSVGAYKLTSSFIVWNLFIRTTVGNLFSEYQIRIIGVENYNLRGGKVRLCTKFLQKPNSASAVRLAVWLLIYM